MNIIYDGEDIEVSAIRLNGKDGAINVTDSEDDLDLTFKDAEVMSEWITTLIERAKEAGFEVNIGG